MPNFDIFEKLAQTLRTLPMETLVERAADRQEDKMIDLNVEQMYSGKTARDTDIQPEYKAKTLIIKKKKGQPTDRVTLRDTKDFHNSVRVKRYPGRYEQIALDSKSEALQEKYGYYILGLTDRNLQTIRNLMTPFLINDVRNILKRYK